MEVLVLSSVETENDLRCQQSETDHAVVSASKSKLFPFLTFANSAKMLVPILKMFYILR